MDEQIFLDFKLNFNLCMPKRNKQCLIYAVVYFRGKQYKVSTGVKVYPNQWNRKKQIAIISNGLTKLDNYNNSIVNIKLQEILCHFEQSKLYLCDNLEQIKNLYQILKQYINPNMKDRNIKKSNGELASTTLSRYAAEKAQGYKGAVSNFKKFLLEKGIEDTWSSINKGLLDKYQDYLCSTPTKGKVVRAYNTINDNLIKLRALLKMAHKDEDIPFDYYKNEIDKFEKINSELSKKEKKSKQVPLTEEQVRTLYELDLSGKEEEVRDVFVCQCLLGQRISDMPKLFRGDYAMTDNNTVTITVQKTKEEATIYLFPIAKELLGKYRERGFKYLNFALTEEEDKENRIADVLNEKIKEICKKAGFDSNITYKEQRGRERITLTKKLYELIHTHIARHTFITIMCNLGIPKETVIIATAHEDTKMIDEVYLHQTSKYNAQKLTLAIEEKAKGSMFNTNNHTREIECKVANDKMKILDYLFAETTLLKLQKYQSDGIDIYRLKETVGAINIIKDIKRTDKTKTFLDNIDCLQLFERVNVLDHIIYEIARHYMDVGLYQIFQCKVIELGLSDRIKEVIDADLLNEWWAQDYANEALEAQNKREDNVE